MYDGDGKRISKTENGITTNYYYEGRMLLYTTDEADNRTSLNITGTESNVIAGVRYDDGESIYFYGKDIKGSTSCITDANTDVVVSYIYDDWGNTTINGDTTFYNQICYTGGVYDELTKLYYLNSRYYNPETGEFMSQDSVRGNADDPSPTNIGCAVWDGVALIAPAVPGTYVYKGRKKVVKVVKKSVKTGVKKTTNKATKHITKKGTKLLERLLKNPKKFLNLVEKKCIAF
ncbi:MAG: hypothetical protein E7270_03300 [Lachnospiraceae bacterium]|nr:hypothetical protein [Lachnospiraceae bacterium]